MSDERTEMGGGDASEQPQGREPSAERRETLPAEAPPSLQMTGDDALRDCVRYLKRRFLGWRDPPVELPSDSVIEEVVRYILYKERT